VAHEITTSPRQNSHDAVKNHYDVVNYEKIRFNTANFLSMYYDGTIPPWHMKLRPRQFSHRYHHAALRIPQFANHGNKLNKAAHGQ